MNEAMEWSGFNGLVDMIKQSGVNFIKPTRSFPAEIKNISGKDRHVFIWKYFLSLPTNERLNVIYETESELEDQLETQRKYNIYERDYRIGLTQLGQLIKAFKDGLNIPQIAYKGPPPTNTDKGPPSTAPYSASPESTPFIVHAIHWNMFTYTGGI